MVAVFKFALSYIFVISIINQQVKLTCWMMTTCFRCRRIVMLVIYICCLIVVLHAFVKAVHPQALVTLTFGFGNCHEWVQECWWLIILLSTIIRIWWHHTKWKWEESHWIWWETVILRSLLILITMAVIF